MSLRPIFYEQLPASCGILAVKVTFVFFVPQSFIQRNIVIRMKKEPLLFVSFNKTSKNAKDSHDEHGYKKLFNSILVYYY